MNMFRIKRKGVTLIELLIVVLILAALSAIAIPRISKSAQSAKQKACHTNIDVMNSSIELFNADTGAYPTALTDVTDDTDYFPDSAPVCPLTEAVYEPILVNNRIDTTDHIHP
jgi:prepilin-type N-terminal cleavage/methylation domain-containing protein